MRRGPVNDVLTMYEVNCYIYKVPRVILAFLYVVGFTALRLLRRTLRQKAVEPLRYTSSDFAKMPSLKRPVRTSTVGRLCRAVLAKRSASCLGLAPPSAALDRICDPLPAVRAAEAWLAHRHPDPESGKAQAAGLSHARFNGRVVELRGSRSSKSADFQSIGA